MNSSGAQAMVEGVQDSGNTTHLSGHAEAREGGCQRMTKDAVIIAWLKAKGSPK